MNWPGNRPGGGPPTSFAHVGSLAGLTDFTPLSLIKVATFLACSGEPLLQLP